MGPTSWKIRLQLLLCLAALAACGGKTVKVDVSLVTAACVLPGPPGSDGGTLGPTDGVSFLRFTVKSGGAVLSTQTVALTSDKLALPQIPVGPAEIDVDGLTDSTPSAQILSSGSTGPFTIPGDGNKTSLSLTVFLRRSNAFTSPSSAGAPAVCSQLVFPRAYHSQVLLPNGQVLIYGGLQYPSSVDWTLALAIPPMVVPGTNYLNSAELYDPATGVFTTAGSWADSSSYPSPRAFGQLLALADGDALEVGGEGVGALALVDPAFGAGHYSAGPPASWTGTPAVSPHAHGCAAADTQGHVLVSGGYLAGTVAVPNFSRSVTSLSTTPVAEYFNPNGAPQPLSPAVALPADAGFPGGLLTAARADHACSGFAGALPVTQNLVALAGGAEVDPSGQYAMILGDFIFYTFGTNPATTKPDFLPGLTSSGYLAGPLLQPRSRAKAAALTLIEPGTSQPSDGLLVSGGMTCTTSAAGGYYGCVPDFADGGTSGQLAQPPFAYFKNGSDPEVAQETELIHFPVGAGGQASIVVSPGPLMQSARIDHCAVALPDGRVLILGGLSGTDSADFGTVATAEIVSQASAGSGLVSTPIVQGLGEARAGLACTLLADGSVLVTGGIQTTAPLVGTSQAVTTLRSAEIYRPLALQAQSSP